jgi:hypothetical protein
VPARMRENEGSIARAAGQLSSRPLGSPGLVMEESWFALTTEQRADLNRFMIPPGWRIVGQTGLPVLFPESLRSRIDSALAVAAPTSTGGTYLIFSALRPDVRHQAVDIEPFGLIVDSSGPSSSGVFLHHGEWPGRTQPAPPEFWDSVDRFGVGDYFFANPPQGKSEGSLDELPIEHKGAFGAIIRALRARRDSGSSGAA